ncbi:hypothetical protein D082_00480 [Synechocystis sp. PCC 6714]|nr:hypothetical protein D082_00480 [Synechocystis sp. PCC 6714]
MNPHLSNQPTINLNYPKLSIRRFKNNQNKKRKVRLAKF